jgi:RNA polymerase sigma-70 factor (ECF subfamily)
VTADDRAAFEALFRSHYDALLRYATHLSGSRADGEELVQEALLGVWRRREWLGEGDLAGYLVRAVRNQAYNAARKRRVEERWRAQMPPGEPSVDPRETVDSDADALRVAVARAIEELPERCREIFLLSRRQGLTYGQIASTLGISVKTVETQMGRALARLRAVVATTGE